MTKGPKLDKEEKKKKTTKPKINSKFVQGLYLPRMVYEAKGVWYEKQRPHPWGVLPNFLFLVPLLLVREKEVRSITFSVLSQQLFIIWRHCPMDMEVIISDSITTSLQNKSPYCVNVFHSWRPFRWCRSCVGCSDLRSCLGLHNLLRMLFFNPLTFLSHLKFFRFHNLLEQCSALLCIIMDKHLQRRVFFSSLFKGNEMFFKSSSTSQPMH